MQLHQSNMIWVGVLLITISIIFNATTIVYILDQSYECQNLNKYGTFYFGGKK